MDDEKWLAARFGAHRTHLRAVAYRMLGSESDADDALQEAWLRLSRSETREVANLGGWLTTVVARVCLDALRSRKARPEDPLDEGAPDAFASAIDERGIDPEREVMLADSVGPALLVVLDTLAPAERLAFVLHDLFAVSFDEIASILGRSPDASRQLASRGRRRVQGAAMAPDADRARQRELVGAFFAAARGGDFDALLAVLDPEIVLRADATAVRFGAAAEVRGAAAVAGTFKGRAAAARVAIVNGVPGGAWVHDGKPRVVFNFTISRGKIVEIYLVGDPESVARLDLTIVEDDASPAPTPT